MIKYCHENRPPDIPLTFENFKEELFCNISRPEPNTKLKDKKEWLL